MENILLADRIDFKQNIFNGADGNPAFKGVDKMDYLLAITDIDKNIVAIIGDSFSAAISENGCYAENISWGIQSALASDFARATLSFTLHDIGGVLFEEFMRLKRFDRKLAFYPPTVSHHNSNGFAMFEKPIMFIPKEVGISFSAIEGFTYSFSGTEIGTSAAHKLLSGGTAKNISTSTNNGWTESYTLRGMIESLFRQWNSDKSVKDDPTNHIFVIFSTDYGDEYWDLYPYDNVTVTDNNTIPKIENFSIEADESIQSALSRLFKLFVSPDLRSSKNPELIVNMKSSSSTGKNYVITIMDSKTDEQRNTSINFYVGLDSVARDATQSIGHFRADLEDLEFDDTLVNLLHAQVYNAPVAATTTMGNEVAAQKTNLAKVADGSNVESAAAVNTNTGSDAIDNTAQASSTDAAGTSNKSKIAGLSKKRTANELLEGASLSMQPITLSLKMPYTSALHPDLLGGPSIIEAYSNESESIMISTTQACYLHFWWYDDYTGTGITKHPLSGEYRIQAIQHTIGSDNMTTVTLTGLGVAPAGKGAPGNNDT